MRYTFIGKNISVRDSLKERTEQKMNRLERLLPEDAEITVSYFTGKQSEKVEVTIPVRKRILRAEITGKDFESCVDSAVDALEKQMVKYRKRLKDKSRRDSAFKDEFAFIPIPENDTDESGGEIVIKKTKKFALKPMDAEEAVMEMELLAHNFFVFRNGHTDEVNVVYKRQDGTYGLIEPEY